MKLFRVLTSKAALGSLALLLSAQQAVAHGVQIGYGILANGFVRVYVEHWHGDAPGLSGSPLNITITSAAGTTTGIYNAMGQVANTAWNNLPGLGSSITILKQCATTGTPGVPGQGGANTYNDWLYWDFAPGACNQPVTITINSGTTAVTTEKCGELYPVTIQGQVFTDQAGPVITAPNVSVVGDCTGAVVNFAPTVVDDCDKNPVVTLSHVSGTRFPVGITPVTVTATDNTGKTSVKIFNVIVVVGDSVAPVLTVPSNITVNNDSGLCGARVTFAATATDNCSVPTVVSTPASGTVFPVGTTTVTSVATDGNNNTTTRTFTVTVLDREAPVLSAPADIVVTAASGNCAANVSFAATASDNCSVTGITYSPASGSSFAVGTTIVTATATDASGNTASRTFKVTVKETQAPTLVAPAANQTVECDGTGNLLALNGWLASNGGAVATDACGPVVWTNNFVRLSDGCGATGSATVVFTATDSNGNSTTTTATFAITDTKAPTIITPAASQTVECDGNGNAAALSAWLAGNGGAVATDTCGAVRWSNNFNGLSDLCGATGAATVTFTATDECGNTATTTATFSVSDTRAPVISTAAASKTVECDGAGNTAALSAWLASNGGAVASDTCSSVRWSHNFAALSDLCAATGTATVTFTATDDCGNTSTSIATFTIVDTTAPVLSSNTRDILPSEAPIVFTVNATDLCGSATASVTRVTAHAINGAGKVIDKSGSAVIQVSGNRVTIVDGGGVGTIITIYASAVDECGNTASATYVVNVLRPANEGVGNGVDGNTPGHDNNGGNDNPGTSPGNPGAKGKKS